MNVFLTFFFFEKRQKRKKRIFNRFNRFNRFNVFYHSKNVNLDTKDGRGLLDICRAAVFTRRSKYDFFESFQCTDHTQKKRYESHIILF